MKRTFALFTISLLLSSVTACNQEQPTKPVTAPKPETTAVLDQTKAVAQGKVVETMNSAGYTYVCVDTGTDKVWAAAPECIAKIGDQVTVPTGTPMRNFHSKTLDRDFELVYFVSAFNSPTGEPLATANHSPAGHPPADGHAATAHGSTPAEVEVTGITKPEGGKTVAEIYANKADLAGKKVTLRGKVVKSNKQIMGKNWLHVRDGSGDAAARNHDLTITTAADAEVGNTVLVTGEVHLAKDFGSGYKYDVILEDADVVRE